jgi:hypothetical protein
MTYTLIAHQELGSAQASITFSSIPATFTDLYLVISPRTNRGALADILVLQFNGVGTGYSRRTIEGSGSSVASGSGSDAYIGLINGGSTTSNTFSNVGVYIPNYASANNKSYSIDGVSEHNATDANQFLWASLWSNTAAITSITLTSAFATNFVQYSSATLYGITAGSSGGVVVS